MGIAMAVATCGAFTAFADPEAKAADLTGHTYTAYQIFSGTQADDETEGKLGDIEWGNGINSTAFLAALKADGTIGTVFTSCNTAADVAEAMKDWADMSDNAKAFAKLAEANKAGSGVPVVNGQTVLDAGYYIVVDTTDTTVTDGQVDAVKNVALLQLTKKGTFEIQNKTDVPEVEKKIGDANDTEAAAITDPAAVTDWRDSADHDVNDVIPYKITGTLPTNYADYDTYKYVFTDTMTAGLTYNADAKVYAVNGSTKTEITSAASILPTAAAAGAKLTVSFADLKAVTGVTIDSTTKIVVEYTCTLNENAKIGVEGNPNTVNLTYSNNPNSGGESETGKTPDDTVIAFTYKVTVNKVKENNVALPGAAFTLYKNYKGTATLPDGKTAVTEIKYNNDKNTYPIATGDKWVQVGTTTAGSDTTQFVFNRIDDGEYLLVETTTPAGYNAVKPNKFVVSATHTEGAEPALTGLSATDSKGTSTDLGEITLAAESDLSGVNTTIENKSGSTLPETGGMGTTIFYIVGIVLLAGAAIILVTRRRMNAE